MAEPPPGRTGAAASDGRAGDPALSAWDGLGVHRPRALHLALFLGAYLLAAGFAQSLAIIPETGISIWPPSGLFMATLILSAGPAWPWWIATGLAGELLGNALWFGNPLVVASLIFAGNALEAMAGAWLVTRFCPRPVRLETLREVLALIGLGAGLAPLISATVGSATLAWFGLQPFARAWPLWWIGDATGVLIFAPLTLVVAWSWQGMERLSPARLVEAGVLALILAAVSALSLSGYLPFAYIVMPALLWAAVRFALKGAALALLLLAMMTAAFTVAGLSPFAGDAATQRQLHVMLQLFLAISALSALVVAALSRQHEQALLTLRAANAELELRVAERTANLHESERRLAAVLETLPLGVALVDRAGEALVSNAVFRGYVPSVIPSKDAVVRELWEGRDDHGRRIEPHGYSAARALRGERVWPGQEFVYHGDAIRGPVWTRVAAVPFRDGYGKIVGATVVVEDIDGKKRADDALRSSEARMRLVQEGTGVGTWDWDIVSGAISWSEQNYRLHGLDSAAGPPSYDDWRQAIHPDDRERANAAVLDAVERRGDFDIEYRIRQPDGALRWLNGRGQTICDGDRPVRMMGINLDITARQQAAEQQLLLAREVDHRAKNVLAVVQSLVRLTKRIDPADFAQALEGRIAALARAHTLLARERWSGGGLRQLIEEELAAYLPTGQVSLRGPPVGIRADAVQPLAMSVHELATNAAKYGSLSTPRGRVAVDWRIDADALVLSWVESDGPAVASPPSVPGFGSKLLQAAIRDQLGGALRISWGGSGFRCELRIPARHLLDRPITDVRPDAPAPSQGAATARPAAARIGLRVLVAEDEALVAMDLGDGLLELGCAQIDTAVTLAELQRLAAPDAERYDLAVLDVNLGGQPSYAVAEALLDRGVPVIFATGYGELPGGRWTDDSRVIVLRKPVAAGDLARALTTLLPQARDGVGQSVAGGA